MHLAGLTSAEIAEQMDCVERTVERKLALLRSRWRKLADEPVES
jgi:DNA-directed RNA polymerase specialized sigma24 family protein